MEIVDKTFSREKGVAYDKELRSISKDQCVKVSKDEWFSKRKTNPHVYYNNVLYHKRIDYKVDIKTRGDYFFLSVKTDA